MSPDELHIVLTEVPFSDSNFITPDELVMSLILGALILEPLISPDELVMHTTSLSLSIVFIRRIFPELFVRKEVTSGEYTVILTVQLPLIVKD